MKKMRGLRALSLSTQTIRVLADRRLLDVNGGLMNDDDPSNGEPQCGVSLLAGCSGQCSGVPTSKTR